MAAVAEAFFVPQVGTQDIAGDLGGFSSVEENTHVHGRVGSAMVRSPSRDKLWGDKIDVTSEHASDYLYALECPCGRAANGAAPHFSEFFRLLIRYHRWWEFSQT
jgi:hypothetical protein